MLKTHKKILLPLLLLSFIGNPAISGLVAADAPTAPGHASLVDMILKGPEKPYQGHLMISLWSEKETKAEDVNIYFTPPNKYRLEFLTPDGSVDRVVLSNGVKEQTQILSKGQVLQTYTKTSPPKFLAQLDEKNLLLENYSLSIQEGGKLLDRDTWLLEWTPLVPGKPTHQMRMDKSTHVVLETKQYLAEGSKDGSLTRFTEFTPNAAVSNDLFLNDLVVDATAETTHKSLAAISDERAKDAQFFSKKLVGGFAFESVNYFDAVGSPVKQVRYTDGLVPLSLFQTTIPVQMNAASAGDGKINLSSPEQIAVSQPGHAFHWKKDKEFYTLIGDVPEPLLQDISKDFR